MARPTTKRFRLRQLAFTDRVASAQLLADVFKKKQQKRRFSASLSRGALIAFLGHRRGIRVGFIRTGSNGD